MKPKAWILGACTLAVSMVACGRLPTDPNENAWRFLPGDVQSLSLPSFRDGRQCWVYLPPGYAQSTRRYPVLYVTDGHIVFDVKGGMHLNRICDDLIRRGEIAPLIVVAITVPDLPMRVMELAPWPDSYLTPSGGGDVFLRGIRDTLKPEVDRRYRTLTGPASTAIAGFSLGGLLAAYAGFAYDSTFGLIAAFSPSYWWGDTTSIYDYVTARGRPALLQRFYQDTGYPRDNRIVGMETLLISLGFSLGRDFLSVTVEGGEHASGAWQQRFPQTLRFLFPP